MPVKKITARNSDRLVQVLGSMGTSVFLLITVFSLAACSTYGAIEDRVDIGLTQQSALYIDPGVHRLPPEVHIQPREQALSAPRVLFVPLRVTQPMEHPGMVSHSISRTIYQTWNTMQLFPVMEFSADETPYRRDRAIALGRHRGADMVIGGFITYFYSGGTVGESQVAIQIEAQDLSSGQIVWSMAQSGAISAPQERDYILFKTKSKTPTDPVRAITKVLAIDMGSQLQTWLAGASPKGKLQQYDEKVKNLIFPESDPVPAPRNPQPMNPGTSNGAF